MHKNILCLIILVFELIKSFFLFFLHLKHCRFGLLRITSIFRIRVLYLYKSSGLEWVKLKLLFPFDRINLLHGLKCVRYIIIRQKHFLRPGHVTNTVAQR